MNLILPGYLNRKRYFTSNRCGFKFFKVTPSQVEKCPKCGEACFENGVKKENLDKYSQYKLRWYTRGDDYHKDEIKRREITYVDNKKVVKIKDERGRTIDYIPDTTVSGDLGKSIE